MKESLIENFTRTDITNDLVFSRVMSKKKNCLRLLQAILPELHLTKIIKIQTQKQITIQMLRKGVRLDIWAQDEQGHTFDLEMQNKNEPGLLKRAEFYASRMNSHTLKVGQNYDEIKDSYVIFLCSFDPSGYNEARYDIVNVLNNHRDQIIDTGKKVIFFNSKSPLKYGLAPDLSAYLQYMNGEAIKNSQFIAELEKGRTEYINGQEWHDTMIDFKAMEEEIRDQGVKQGTKLSIIKFVSFLRNDSNCSDEKILNILVKQYGDTFSKDELQKLIKQKNK